MLIPDNIAELMSRLLERGHKVYVIGGAVRDFLLGIEPKDYDLFTDASGDQIQAIFSDKPCKVMGGAERQEKILTVIVDGTEISQFRKNGDRTEVGNTLDEHLSTCDITINAISSDIDGHIYDPHAGMVDLESEFDRSIDCNSGCIRAVGDPRKRIAEDKLRAMRAIRFSCKFGYVIDADLQKAIMETDITTLPRERTTEEMLKILAFDNGPNTMRYLGILRQLIPELMALDGLDGGGHHDEDVLMHSLLTYAECCKLTSNVLLRFTALVHDIGKARTVTLNKEGRNSFKKHEIVGPDMLSEIMERMKFSAKDILYVTTMVRNHMLSARGSEPGRKTCKELFIVLDDAEVPILDFMTLLYSDTMGNRKQQRILFSDFLKDDGFLVKYYTMKFSQEPFKVKDMKVNGHDVMALGVKEGPLIGKLLTGLFDEINEGILLNERNGLLARLQAKIAEAPI